MENTSLKKLPCGATKKQIFEMYPKESDSYLRELCQHIQITNNPHIDEKKAKHRQKLSRKEFLQLVDTLGTPNGYADPEK